MTLLLDQTKAGRVREGYVEYNETWREPLKRSAKCRCCGDPIPKGAEALRFWWDFTGHGRHFITKCAMHLEECQSTDEQRTRHDGNSQKS